MDDGAGGTDGVACVGVTDGSGVTVGGAGVGDGGTAAVADGDGCGRGSSPSPHAASPIEQAVMISTAVRKEVFPFQTLAVLPMFTPSA
ncbi:MAG: hypothetical protein AB7V27_18250 [Candidatus Binatia bacterium]